MLNHPDRRTSWIVVMSIQLGESLDLEARVARRLREIGERVPGLGARWRDGRWHPGALPEPTVVDGDPLRAPELLRPFALEREALVRVLVGSDGRRLALAAHHALLDGRGMVTVMRGMLGETLSAPGKSPSPATAGWPSLRAPLRRLIAPADRVAPSASPARQDSLAVREVAVQPPNITGAIAQACVAAAAARNARLGRPWRRVGLSIALGGPPGIGNAASYRRLDLRADDPVAAAVHRALRGDEVPPELRSAPRALRMLTPIASRFSDSLLISNLALEEIPGVEQLALFPVARGRSAVSFGGAAVRPGRSTLSVRARDLDQADAEDLLEDAARAVPFAGLCSSYGRE